MDGGSRHSWFRSARSPSVLLVALVVLLGVAGYVLTTAAIRHDRDEAAERRAEIEVVHTQEVLDRARSYVGGLGDVLAREPNPGQARFASWAGATSASVGLNDVLWVERVPASKRGRYERARGVRITRLTSSGRIVPAPAAPSYLPATYTSQTRPELRPGVDGSGFPGLGAAIRDRARIFAVGASRPGALGKESGFYLLQAATFARGPGSRGYLVAFVPRGWFSTTLGGDPRRVAISQDGRTLEGALDSVQASAGFEMLGRNWRIDVAREPATVLQSTLPWLALAWPFALAGIAAVIGRAITQRRRAQRGVERIFEMSLDMICLVGFDGRFKALNPAFERTLGYTMEELVARPFLDVVHPDDRQATSDAFAHILGGGEIKQFENRYVCKDGSERWLEWSSRSVPGEDAVYAIARDVTESRRISQERARLAQEQAALRRVATLVARDAPQQEVFSAIADSVAELFGTDDISMSRFEAERARLIVASSGRFREAFPVGSRQQLIGDNVGTRVFRTGKPVRIDDYGIATGPIAEAAQSIGIQTALATPIVVEGRLWGALTIATHGDQTLPPETEERLGQFTELMATAIANTDSRDQLAASRVRLVTAADEARRQVVRDLHDGAQQGLVHTIVSLKLAQQAFGEGDGKAEALIAEALDYAERSNAELRELARGILPAILTRGGLRAGIDAVVSRLALPVRVDVPPDRLPLETEASAYFIVAEALTNVMKHSRATRAEVRASVKDSVVRVEVQDDGIGGADPAGHGLVGMADRVSAMGGRLTVESPPGDGTLVAATLPLSGS